MVQAMCWKKYWGGGVGADTDLGIGFFLAFGECGGWFERLNVVVVVFCPVSRAALVHTSVKTTLHESRARVIPSALPSPRPFTDSLIDQDSASS